jgi:hypothetical protein
MWTSVSPWAEARDARGLAGGGGERIHRRVSMFAERSGSGDGGGGGGGGAVVGRGHFQLVVGLSLLVECTGPKL